MAQLSALPFVVIFAGFCFGLFLVVAFARRWPMPALLIWGAVVFYFGFRFVNDPW